MLQDGNAIDAARRLQEAVRFPISGYDRSVDWAASALIEFHYLDMILGRGLSPADAAQQLLRLLNYAGEENLPGSPYPAAGFRILMPNSR
jgi:ATP phosphoribosyltransferase regulatory subunit HisZ